MKNLEEDIKNERGGVSVLEPSSKENSKENVSQIQKDQESVRKEIQNLKELLLQKEENKKRVLSDFEDKIQNLKKEVVMNK